VKTLKQALLILASSPLLWIGTAGALVSFLTYYLLYSGHLQPMAGLADALHVGFYVPPFLAFVLLAGICLAIGGVIIGTIRLCRKPNENPAAKAPKQPL
jgi:hypothetical protein